MRKYFYHKLRAYLDLDVRPDDRMVEIDPKGMPKWLQFENYLALDFRTSAFLRKHRRRPNE